MERFGFMMVVVMVVVMKMFLHGNFRSSHFLMMARAIDVRRQASLRKKVLQTGGLSVINGRGDQDSKNLAACPKGTRPKMLKSANFLSVLDGNKRNR